MTQDILGFETQVSHEGPARETGVDPSLSHI